MTGAIAPARARSASVSGSGAAIRGSYVIGDKGSAGDAAPGGTVVRRASRLKTVTKLVHFRGCSGLTKEQAVLEHNLLRRCTGLADLGEQSARRKLAHLMDRLADRGQWREGDGRFHDAVVAQDRQLVRHPDAEAMRRLHGANREYVGRRKDRRDARVVGEQQLGFRRAQFDARVWKRARKTKLGFRGERAAGLHHPKDALEPDRAGPARRSRRGLLAGNDTDAEMAEVQQVPHAFVAPREIIANDRTHR